MAKLHFTYGVMAAAKSAELCIQAYKLRKAGNKYEAIKPEKDNRDSDNKIKPRIKGLHEPALVLKDFDNYQPKADTQFILIDEVQFFSPKDIYKLSHIADTTDITIFCWGLNIDSDGQIFPAAATLFAEANEMERKETVCEIDGCTKMASHHIKFAPDGSILRGGPQIDIGGAEKYISVCRCCFHNLYDDETSNLYRYMRLKKAQAEAEAKARQKIR